MQVVVCFGVAGKVAPRDGLRFLRGHSQAVDTIDAIVGSPGAIEATCSDVIEINSKIRDELQALQWFDVHIDLSEDAIFGLPVLIVGEHTNGIVSVAKQIEASR